MNVSLLKNDLSSLFPSPLYSHLIWRGLAPQNKPELQKVMEKRKRDQVIKQQKEEEAQKKKSDLEIELLKRQQKLEQVRWEITLTLHIDLWASRLVLSKKEAGGDFWHSSSDKMQINFLQWVNSCTTIASFALSDDPLRTAVRL